MELLTDIQKKAKPPIPTIGMESVPTSSKNDRACRIVKSAYYKAAARGFEPGREMEDWLEAEAEEGEW